MNAAAAATSDCGMVRQKAKGPREAKCSLRTIRSITIRPLPGSVLVPEPGNDQLLHTGVAILADDGELDATILGAT